MRFDKYEGLGNDFIVVEQELSEAVAIALCDRHLGVGADGVLIVSRTPDHNSKNGADQAERAGYAMRVINADGSVPEMCGNGIRCVALHLARTGRVQIGQTIEIATDAGPHACRVLELGALFGEAGGEAGGRAGLVDVLMQPASLEPREIGLRSDQPLIDEAVAVGSASLRLTAVSMGNPHAVTFQDVGEARLTLGPLIEKHALFSRGANAGFAKMTGSNSLDLRVFERGAGWTQACGTGACAAAVAAVETARAQRGEPLEVRLPGGVLSITVPEPGSRVRMQGPARHVFVGELRDVCA